MIAVAAGCHWVLVPQGPVRWPQSDCLVVLRCPYFLLGVGSSGLSTGRGSFSFFLLAVGMALHKELASFLQLLQSLHVSQLLAPGAVEMSVFSVPFSQDLPDVSLSSFILFHDL